MYLDVAESKIGVKRHLLGHAVCVLVLVANSVGVNRYGIAMSPQQPPHRQARRLAQQVPQGDIDSADRAHGVPGGSLESPRPVEHPLPMKGYARRVLSNEQLLELGANQRGIAPATHTDSPVVSMNPDNRPISKLTPVVRPPGDPQRDDFDSFDAHLFFLAASLDVGRATSEVPNRRVHYPDMPVPAIGVRRALAADSGDFD